MEKLTEKRRLLQQQTVRKMFKDEEDHDEGDGLGLPVDEWPPCVCFSIF